MAKYNQAKCRLCRREGTKLFLKGERCYSPKCPLERKGAVPPGEHGPKRTRRVSDYGRQLREKQKVKRMYGVLEKQFGRYFKKARRTREATGEALIQILESRLDNLVFRLGLVPSRSVGRQIIRHGFVTVNGRKVDIPSYQVKPGQVVGLAAKALKMKMIKDFLSEKEKKIPDWLQLKAAVGKMIRLPERKEIKADIDEKLIVEFYSR